MSVPVYSTRFINAQVVVGSPVSATVPNGFVWVVRSIYIAANVTGNTAANLVIANGAYLARVVAASASNGTQIETRQVLNAGDVLQAAVAGGPAYFLVSGYQLTVPAPGN